jgi:hypothetical protein
MQQSTTTPLVSVVVRSMARPTLERALASIAQQDYPRVEAVVANALGAGHPPPAAMAGPHPVVFVPSDRRLTRPEAANAGQDAAHGDWITFLDDDDLLLPTHISGLVAAAGRAGDALLVNSLAQATLANGKTQVFGQPSSPAELYQRNYIHMSTALWSRELVTRGARFDERCTTHQDWDFFLQCMQMTRFHFEPLRTFQWFPDAGESGTWGGNNLDDEQISRMCTLIFDKWKGPRDALLKAVVPMRREAAEHVQRGDLVGARQRVEELLALCQNDAYGLNILAAIELRTGNLDAAEHAQTIAVSVRPADAGLVFNLALLHQARGNATLAQQFARATLTRAPGHQGAQALLAQAART